MKAAQPPRGTTFYTFKKNVKLLPGQVVHFLRGKGYFAFGKAKSELPPITMYDSIVISEIPAGAAAVAGYVGGHWPTFPKLAAAFPHAHRLSIAVRAGQDAETLDVEAGDAVNADAPTWVRRQIARGVKKPVVYTSVSNAAALLATLQSAGISRDQVRLWTAHYTFVPHRCTSKCGFGFTGIADATQYTDHALGRNLDASLVSGSFFAEDV